MDKEFVSSRGDASLPFVNAVKYGQIIFLSGMVSKNLETGASMYGTIEEETSNVFENIKKLLEGAGSSMDKILKATVFLKDISQFDRMNKIYKSYFSTEKSLATRSTVEVNLVGEYKIEIEVIAYM
jgi:2-iminobutanoate/2-iminopropanoate deaminase